MKNEVISEIMKNQPNLSSEELCNQISLYFEKEQKEKRLIVLQAYLIAKEHSDEIFEIVVKENPTEELMCRLGLTKFQAQTVLKLSIKRFIELNRQKIENEINQLNNWLSDYEINQNLFQDK